MSQKYSNIEWIIVDDCSSDGSGDILRKFNDDRIKVLFNSSRMFCSSAYAKALEHASGEICGVLDADDAIDNNAVEIIVQKYIEHPEVDFIYTQHYWCDIKLRPIRGGISSLPTKGHSLVSAAIGSKKHCFSHWRTFRKSIASASEIFPEGLKYAVDKNMGFVLEELGQGAFLNKKLYLYRYYNGNMSLLNAKDQKSTWLKIAHEMNNKRNKNGVRVRNIQRIS
jgi:glycosyltransferase involved in cell wall biosynthesis